MRFILLLIALPAVLVNTARSAPESRPNVLFLLADDLRPDAIAALGNPVIRTPHLDRLARRGQCFTHAVANNPLCVPSRAEILTGCSGFANGVLPGYSNTLNANLVTWPAALRQAGYRTAVVGKWHLSGRPADRGYEQADGLYSSGGGKAPASHEVDSYNRKITGYTGWVFQSADGKTKFPDKGVGLTPDINREFAHAAIRLLRQPDPRPFFIHVNFTAPHDPLLWPTGYQNAYTPDQIRMPANFLPVHPFDHGNLKGRDELFLPFPRTEPEVRRELALYYSIISHLDEQVGRILAALESAGKLDNTLVIFSSDHGLAKGSHGLTGKQNMYQHTVNVPMILAGPSIAPGKIHKAQVQLRDLYPTICDLAGVPIPPTVQAQSFAPILRGRRDSIRDEVFCYFMGYQRMIRTDRHKYIVYPHLKREQLFDLSTDPDEIHDRISDPAQAAVLNDLRRRLARHQEALGDPLRWGNPGAGSKSGKN